MGRLGRRWEACRAFSEPQHRSPTAAQIPGRFVAPLSCRLPLHHAGGRGPAAAANTCRICATHKSGASASLRACQRAPCPREATGDLQPISSSGPSDIQDGRLRRQIECLVSAPHDNALLRVPGRHLEKHPQGDHAGRRHAHGCAGRAVLLRRRSRVRARRIRFAGHPLVRSLRRCRRSVFDLHNAAIRQRRSPTPGFGRRLFISQFRAKLGLDRAAASLFRSARPAGAALFQSSVHGLRRRPHPVRRCRGKEISSRKSAPPIATANTIKSPMPFNSSFFPMSTAIWRDK